MIVWGFQPHYYLTNDKISPTRWAHQYGLVNPNYTTDEMLLQFLEDIKEYKPLILDTAVAFSSVPRLGSEYWQETPTRKLIVDYIKENYVHVEDIGPLNFPLYIPIDESADK